MNLVAIPPVVSPLARPQDTARIHLRGAAFGTTWSVIAHAPPDRRPNDLRAAVSDALAEVAAEMSGWDPGSELCRFNRAEAGSWQRLSPGHFGVLRDALRIAAATGGAFDPCLGGQVECWGFGPSGPVAIPPAALPDGSLTAGRPGGTPDWQRLQLRAADLSVLQPGGVTLDLSAIGKGHAVDRVCRQLQQLDIVSLLVEIGGELRGEGIKPDGSPWWVGLEDLPPETAGGLPTRGAVVVLHGQAVATSGDHRRHFEHDGRRFGHVLDPQTGAPARTDLASVSVLSRHCQQADAYATALASQTADRALALADRLGLAALLRLRDGQLRLSQAFAAML